MNNNKILKFDLAINRLILFSLLSLTGIWIGFEAEVDPQDLLSGSPIIGFLSRKFPEYNQFLVGVVSSLGILFFIFAAVGISLFYALTQKLNRSIILNDKMILIPNFSRSVPYIVMRDQIKKVEDVSHYLILHVNKGASSTKILLIKKWLNSYSDLVDVLNSGNQSCKSYAVLYSKNNDTDIVKSSALLQKIFKVSQDKALKFAEMGSLVIKKNLVKAEADKLKTKLGQHGLETIVEPSQEEFAGEEAVSSFKMTQITGIPTPVLLALFLAPGSIVLWMIYVDWFLAKFRNKTFGQTYFIAFFIEIMTYNDQLASLKIGSVSQLTYGAVILLGLILINFIVAVSINDLKDSKYYQELKLNYLLVFLFGPLYINYRMNRVGKQDVEQLDILLSDNK